MRIDLTEFRSAYLTEVDEHLSGVDVILMKLDDAVRHGQAQPREFRELMRLLHTIKGLSAMVGVEPIVTLAHRMETVVRSAESSGGQVGEAALDALVDGARAIATRVKELTDGREASAPPAAVVAALDAAVSTEAPAVQADAASFPPDIDAKLGPTERRQLIDGVAAGRRAVRLDFTPSRERADAGLTITTVRERLAAIAELVKVLPIGTSRSEATPGGLIFALLLLTTADDATLAGMVGGSPADVTPLLTAPALLAAPVVVEADVEPGERGRGVLRVEVGRLDQALDGLSALITTRFRLAGAVKRLAQLGADTRELSLVMADHDRQLRDMRAAILRLRMVPLTGVFERLPLVVRSLMKTSGKRVHLEIDGGSAEVDKTVAERLFPALVHMLRNAVDHGIERSEERVRAGKPEAGTLRISCETQNRQVEIRVSDDGKGIDRARLAAKTGRDTSDPSTLLAILCAPGLSTRSEVDTTSGRGMGMDIVRRIVVDGLGGELVLENTGESGTTFVVRVPLTVAIVDSFTIRCRAERFVVPVPLVDEIVELEEGMIMAGPVDRARTRFFTRRGEVVPLVDLGELLSLPPAAGTHQALVVRRSREEPLAFAVERVLGQQETVVRPLGDPLVNVIGVAGSTDLGDGRATIVLDLVGLASRLEGTAA